MKQIRDFLFYSLGKLPFRAGPACCTPKNWLNYVVSEPGLQLLQPRILACLYPDIIFKRARRIPAISGCRSMARFYREAKHCLGFTMHADPGIFSRGTTRNKLPSLTTAQLSTPMKETTHSWWYLKRYRMPSGIASNCPRRKRLWK